MLTRSHRMVVAQTLPDPSEFDLVDADIGLARLMAMDTEAYAHAVHEHVQRLRHAVLPKVNYQSCLKRHVYAFNEQTVIKLPSSALCYNHEIPNPRSEWLARELAYRRANVIANFTEVAAYEHGLASIAPCRLVWTADGLPIVIMERLDTAAAGTKRGDQLAYSQLLNEWVTFDGCRTQLEPGLLPVAPQNLFVPSAAVV